VVSDFYQHPDLYDALLPVGAHLPFYAELAREHADGMLELACGTGQLAVPIAGSGVQTVGLDRSAAMLTTARTRAELAGVTCDFVDPDPSILARPKGQRFPLMNVDTDTFGRLSVEGTHDYDAAGQTDRGTWYVSTGDEPDKWVVSVVVRSIFPQELPLLLHAGGFRVMNRFGTLSRTSFSAGSPQQVCVCQAMA
jgi:SAM-dependent methyltransferase